MKLFKLLLKDIPQESTFGDYKDKDEVKCGKVAFPFKGENDDTKFDLKKGDEVYYQYGTPAKIDGEDYILVSLSQLVCQK